MSTVYLHIGTPKTGTTALQEFLLLNRDVFEQHGLCYPDFGFRYPGIGVYRNGHFLIAMKSRKQEDAGREDSPQKGERIDYARGLSMLADCAKTHDRIILTDEVIYSKSRRVEGNFYKILKEDLAGLGMDLKIILYIRRQDLFIQSHWAQKVKVGMKKDFHKYLASSFCTNYPLNYLDYINYLADSIGKDALIIRPYERGQFQGEKPIIQSDFLSIFGLKLSDGFALNNEDYNTRLDAEYLELQLVVNTFPGMYQPQPDNPLRHDVLEGLYFKPEEQQAFLDQYTESNRTLAREYLGREDGVLFYDEVKPAKGYKLRKNDLPQDIAVVYGRAISELLRRNKQLEQEVKELSEQVNNSFFTRLERKLEKIFKSKR